MNFEQAHAEWCCFKNVFECSTTLYIWQWCNKQHRETLQISQTAIANLQIVGLIQSIIEKKNLIKKKNDFQGKVNKKKE